MYNKHHHHHHVQDYYCFFQNLQRRSLGLMVSDIIMLWWQMVKYLFHLYLADNLYYFVSLVSYDSKIYHAWILFPCDTCTKLYIYTSMVLNKNYSTYNSIRDAYESTDLRTGPCTMDSGYVLSVVQEVVSSNSTGCGYM